MRWSCEITCKTKYIISPPARPMNTKLGKLLTCTERLPFLEPHDSLIKWATWGQVTISKIYISTITWVMVSKPGRVLTHASGFSTQKLKSCPTFCNFWKTRGVSYSSRCIKERVFDLFKIQSADRNCIFFISARTFSFEDEQNKKKFEEINFRGWPNLNNFARRNFGGYPLMKISRQKKSFM